MEEKDEIQQINEENQNEEEEDKNQQGSLILGKILLLK